MGEPSCEGSVKSGALLPSDGAAERESKRGARTISNSTKANTSTIRNMESSTRTASLLRELQFDFLCSPIEVQDAKTANLPCANGLCLGRPAGSGLPLGLQHRSQRRKICLRFLRSLSLCRRCGRDLARGVDAVAEFYTRLV